MRRNSLGKVNLLTIKVMLATSREQEDFSRTEQLLTDLQKAIQEEIGKKI